jgi:hypothetical protein
MRKVGWRTNSPIAPRTDPDGAIRWPHEPHTANAKPSIVHASRNAPHVAVMVPGTGKGHATSPATTHKTGGAVLMPRKAIDDFDGRGRRRNSPSERRK